MYIAYVDLSSSHCLNKTDFGQHLIKASIVDCEEFFFFDTATSIILIIIIHYPVQTNAEKWTNLKY